ncbi:probable ubiquitin carboxyl-terminal hydrolase MINDY-4 [Dermacentor andersoni]|uniref:probable ubiquitin carboxyl-terminal hydrolase MINDY-4 n=1 Tax=Dermacentor andersoni TaxID=34620 RepID=UPI002155164E
MIGRNMIETSSAYGTASIQARCVEDVSCCIVREYLSRKGLTDTLAKMDKEFPRNEGCFTARDQLIRAAFMERLVRDNKARDSPFRALLEMLIYERLQKKSVKSRHGSKVNLVPSAGDSARHVEMNIRNNNCVPVASKEAKSESSDSLSSLEGALPVRTVADTDRPQSARGRREPGGFIVRRPARNDIESVHRLISKSQQYRGPTRVTNSAIQRMEEALKHEPGVHDGEGDRIDTDHLPEKYGGNFAGSSSHVITRSALQSALSARSAERKLVARGLYSGEAPTKAAHSLHSPRSSAFPNLQAETWTELDATMPRLQHPGCEPSSPTSPKSFLLRSQSAPRLELTRRKSNSVVATGSPNNQTNKDCTGKASPKLSVQANNDVQVSDVSDQDAYIDPLVITAQQATFRPISRQEATELKELLFGTRNGKFGEEWASQGFTFTKSNAVPYGLLQKKGGPCGVLAAVQAYMIKELLWPEGGLQNADPSGFEVDVPRRNAALARALAFILWQVGDSNKAIVANPTGVNVSPTDGILASDGIIETLTLSTFTSKAALQEYYSSCIFKLQEENCSSCVAFLISVLMTHGFERIREEMDERNSSLIGKHSHCNQEVVNLLLVGKAVTNVFDNKLCFGKEETTVLRGITSRSNIGLLSLYEHYKSCKVGSYYKDPKYPIWIVLSDSHFSVLFSKSFLALSPEDEKFDLFYYDGLNKQEEEVRLTIDPTAGISNEDVVMTPPLELCIRTRWQGASVSWNNAEPLL